MLRRRHRLLAAALGAAALVTRAAPGAAQASSPAPMTSPTPPGPAPAPSAYPSSAGIPGARNVDHVGVTVPDMDQALRFFTGVLGARLLFVFDEGPGTAAPMDTRATFDVDPRSRVRIAMLRMGPNVNVELMQYTAPDQRRRVPPNSDVDVPHLAFYVDDMQLAADYLAAHGCTLLGGPNSGDTGPKAGQAIRYFKAPWGMSMEILTRPAHMPYERQTSARLYGPAPAWSAAP